MERTFYSQLCMQETKCYNAYNQMQAYESGLGTASGYCLTFSISCPREQQLLTECISYGHLTVQYTEMYCERGGMHG